MYRGVERTVFISNAIWIDRTLSGNASMAPLSVPVTLGFISNVSKEKGVLVLLDLLRQCEVKKIPVKGIIAGPFENSEIEEQVLALLNRQANVKYVGPIYGVDKENFYRGIDVLVFPTRYINESEPLVVLEALSYGVPVLAGRRGCIQQILSNGAGEAWDVDEAFVGRAIDLIRHWQLDPQNYLQRKAQAYAKYRHLTETGSRVRLQLREIFRSCLKNQMG
jgi:glycosyltransferase involved in cell wall biosynthesis